MNKKIILIQPRYPTSPFPGPHLPVGLGYIAEQLIKAAIEYEIVDMNFNDFYSLRDKILSFMPDFIGISLMSLDIKYHCELILKIKEQFPHIKIIAGGPHISFVKEEALRDCPDIDIGVTHEGEDALIELIRADSPAGINGVIYKTNGKVVYNGDRNYIRDLDVYQFPTYKKFDLTMYSKRISIISSRGCPFNCIFCGAHFSMGKKWRSRTAESITMEIEFWHRKGYADFNFVDSNFFLDKKRVIKLCDNLKGKRLNITMTSDGMRAEDADVEMLKKMKEFGLSSVAMGVESANEEVLRRIKKGETLSQIENGIKTCIDLGINVDLFFIIGLPSETRKDIENSFNLALKYPIRDVYFFNVNPLPKTEMYEWAEKNNYLLASREKMFDNIGGMGEEPLMVTPELSYNDRKKLYKKGLSVQSKVRRRSAWRARIRNLSRLFDLAIKRIAY